ncbi:hypothetical protein L2W42_22870 (plasmid) [Rhizobium gallicum]|nr:hypothetical protein [Rhizobium gallicum]ULJ74271.1 hypothetical protein L2W42_22870 [Rhizobium gallicum]
MFAHVLADRLEVEATAAGPIPKACPVDVDALTLEDFGLPKKGKRVAPGNFTPARSQDRT